MISRSKGKGSSEKVGSKAEKEAIEEKQQIDQSLYSSVILRAEKDECTFFGLAVGLWDEAKRKKLSGVDTNMWCSGTLVSGQEFLIEGIRFKDRAVHAQREHLMEHGYFFIRVADRDYFMYPFHLMDNYFYHVERRFSIPLLLPEYFNFNVTLRLDKPYYADMELTCELMGKLKRPR